ncbi:MAG TPA: DUF1549 and DUF1553 domain-containing protein [Tepidisphaeraceae bacterium]|nr:DUF1549 and DUF1553 domain-containing protein [Tepidisphaeraceae bacterium]
MHRKRAKQIIATVSATAIAVFLMMTWLGTSRRALAAGAPNAPAPQKDIAAIANLARPSFRNDVMPVFMVAGCNSGACHGSARGQDGFRLSLFGFDPDGDYFRITREMPNRRINLAQPTESLLLQKAIGAVPHTGGSRFNKDSPYYKTILAWIEAGAQNDPKDIPTPVSLDLSPKELLLKGPGETKQMTAKAKYSDGSERDVTNLAVFMTSNDNSAAVSHEGLVTAKNRGEAFVMARFATFTVGSQTIVVPKDAPTYVWPNVPENNYIDKLVNAKLQKLQILPSEVCDDETFVRRVYVDVIGLLPTREEVDSFVASKEPKKREQLVDHLLTRPEFVDLWVMKWAELLKIRSTDDVREMSYKATLLYFDWLKDQLTKNVPINLIVKQLISSTGGTFKNPPTNYYQTENETLKVAENTAQIFAGIRMQCAQCHNHPFDRWTMNDYYGFASFFTQIGRKPAEDARETVIFNSGGGEVNHPLTGKPVPAKFLGGAVADVNGKDRRAVLAEWLTSPDNPYFSRNIANLTWAQFFGKGIVEPVDDVRVSNPPSNPQLLDELAKKLVEYNYDLKKLVRDICLSRTYQLASTSNATNEGDSRSFSHASVRRIRAEVLLDCISEVTEAKEKFRGLPLGARAVQIADGRTNNYFLRTFGRATRETVCSCEVKMEPNLSQALHLLNGATVQKKIETGGVIKRLLAAKKTPQQITEELYLRSFARKPTKEETAKIDAALAESPNDPAGVLTDLFWALLNSKEFIFTH